jgi:NAD(P)-dependent dehydrogenase (short-subunit alcohol dehydrogenase family)
VSGRPERPNAIVTGASRGLGFELAKVLAKRGWRLVVDARRSDELEAAAAELGALGEVIALPGDIADERHRRELVAAAGKPIDLLVNNASVLGPSPRPALADYPLAELERVYSVNVLAPLALAQVALTHLGDGAAILNITSDAGIEAYEGWGGYGSSKAALDQLTAVLAAEHPDLRIYSVDPGDMRTAMHQEAFPGEDISDRPPPSESVPALLGLIEGGLPSGRYRAADLVPSPSAR